MHCVDVLFVCVLRLCKMIAVEWLDARAGGETSGSVRVHVTQYMYIYIYKLGRCAPCASYSQRCDGWRWACLVKGCELGGVGGSSCGLHCCVGGGGSLHVGVCFCFRGCHRAPQRFKLCCCGFFFFFLDNPFHLRVGRRCCFWVRCIFRAAVKNFAFLVSVFCRPTRVGWPCCCEGGGFGLRLRCCCLCRRLCLLLGLRGASCLCRLCFALTCGRGIDGKKV